LTSPGSRLCRETSGQQDLYVTQLADLVSDGIVSEYPSSGASAINAQNFPITGLRGPAGLAISGNNLYVANQANLPTGDDPKGTIKGTVGLYNANSGKAINAQFITGLSKPTGLAVAGNTLYVSSFIPNGTVSAYTANTGAPAPGFTTIPGLSQQTGLAVAGGILYVASFGTNIMKGGVIGTYNANSGEAINPTLITQLSGPSGVIVTGGTLFVSNEFGGTIGEYTVSGDGKNAIPTGSITTGMTGPSGLALASKGTLLFVANTLTGTVSAYDISAGGGANIISGLTGPAGLAIKNQ